MISSVLQTRLETIDGRCEASARDKIDRFYGEALYDGHRFRYPSFEEVVGVWFRLIQNKETEFIAETKRILDGMASVDDAQLSDITNMVTRMLEDHRYIDRLKMFVQGVARKASSYGITFNEQACRLDLADAAYRAGVENLLRLARQNITAEMQLYLSTRGVQMGFSSLMTDTVSVLKKDGRRFDGIKASVQKGKIFMSGCTLLIESGDLIQRKMSNGGEETFEVIDPGFHEQFHSIPAGYQMTVKKLGIPEAQKAVQNITYNVAGPNARINQNSIDNSVNIANVHPDVAEYIEALRSAVQAAELVAEQKKTAKEVIDAVNEQFQSGRPSRTVVTTLLAALPHVANVATIVTSLLALL